MNAPIRPIHVPGGAAFQWLRDRVQSALDDWGREWVSGFATLPRERTAAQVIPAAEAPRTLAHEYELVHTDAGSIWFRSSKTERLATGCAVVGDELMPRASCADDWIAGVVDCAWLRRNETLTSALLGRPAPGSYPPSLTAVPDVLLNAASGAIFISCEALGLQAIADHHVWDSMPPTRQAVNRLPALTPAAQAVGDVEVTLEVILGSAEVEFAKLCDLRGGDVLVLPQPIGSALTVSCSGAPIARAALGRQQGMVCIQVIGGIS